MSAGFAREPVAHTFWDTMRDIQEAVSYGPWEAFPYLGPLPMWVDIFPLEELR